VLAHLAELVEATDLPVNADFEGGFATDVRLPRAASTACRQRRATATSIG
jgi:2-methylisocitrate lyase-like PEP mutase family enzyme